jgi:hypothetical protein
MVKPLPKKGGGTQEFHGIPKPGIGIGRMINVCNKRIIACEPQK